MILPTNFPDDKTVTLQLIDLYLKSNKSEEALKYIKVAKEADPNNSSLYFAAGIMYLNQKNMMMPFQNLQKQLNLNRKYSIHNMVWEQHISIRHADMFVKANDIMDVKKYSDGN